MEGVAFEIKNAWNGWKFWSIEGTVGHNQELTRHVIALIGFDPPAIVIVFKDTAVTWVPRQALRRGQSVLRCVCCAREFRGKRIFIFRHVAEFFAKR